MTCPSELRIDLPDGPATVPLDHRHVGRRLSDLLREQALPLNTRCGNRGLCDGCVVELTQGCVKHLLTGRVIESNGHPVRLRACEHGLCDAHTTAAIAVGPRSMLAHEPQVLTDFAVNVPRAHDPIGGPIPGVGIAIDIGTTTVVVLAVDLADGTVLAKASNFNQQMHLGDDVLTRINLCMTDPSMLAKFQKSVSKGTIAPLIDQALAAAGKTPSDLRCIVAAGNTTMQHLIAGVDPTPMGFAPFTPPFLEHRVLDSATVGVELKVTANAPAARPVPLHLLPSAAAYVGADLVAGVLSSGLSYDVGPSLLVDIGTNGEIIARHRGKLLGCATAAGPAFEGSRLMGGMRAVEGAIDHVRFDLDPFVAHVSTIGQGKPIGICGSAYIDLLAEVRRIGLVNERGRFVQTLPEPLAARVKQEKHCKSFVVTKGHGQADIVISETDIVALMQAKAAIAAGITTLLAHLGMTPEHVATLYLAGGFGMHLNLDNAIAMGILPGFRKEQVKLVGNTSLAGAYLALVDRSALDEMHRIASRMEVVELNLDPEFESRYIDNLSLL